MIIIAQPAVVPLNAYYANTMQQLLNYFHNNPQARYQFLQGNYRQHPVPQLTSQPPTAQTIGHYQMFPASPQYQQSFVTLPAPSQPPTSMMLAQPLRNYPQPTSPSIPQTIHLAQAPAQQYSYPSQQYQNELENIENGKAREEISIRSLPPIITGFENFTPEQQAKIKAQLAEHFGAPLKPLPTDSHSHQREQQNQGLSQVSSKYRYFSDSGNFKEYSPNEEVKNENLNVAKTTYSKM